MATGFFNKIVQVNVSQQYAPEPNTLQESAAIVSMNSTTVPDGTAQYISQPGILLNYLTAIIPTEIEYSDTTKLVTVTFSSDVSGYEVGDTLPIIIEGSYPTGYNGTFLGTVATATTITYPLASNPSLISTLPNVYYGYAAWLISADKTWWSQNGQTTGYWLFESGSDVVSDVLDEIDNYFINHSKEIYNWCFLPSMADTSGDVGDLKVFFDKYNTLTSLIKFYVTIDNANYSDWDSHITDPYKNVFVMAQQMNSSTVNQVCAISYAAFITNIKPTPSNKLPSSSYAYLWNVDVNTASNSDMQNFISANVNFAASGAEGGISNVILVYGNNLDGTPQNVAYSIDWQQIQLDLSISNAIINGSNSQINPLYYNQDGINRLQAVAGATAARGISTGLAIGRVILVQLTPEEFTSKLSSGEYAGNYVINAVPFATYTAQNPSDYAQGLYGGFQASFVPQYGFKRIVFNLEATQFAG